MFGFQVKFYVLIQFFFYGFRFEFSGIRIYDIYKCALVRKYDMIFIFIEVGEKI